VQLCFQTYIASEPTGLFCASNNFFLLILVTAIGDRPRP